MLSDSGTAGAGGDWSTAQADVSQAQSDFQDAKTKLDGLTPPDGFSSIQSEISQALDSYMKAADEESQGITNQDVSLIQQAITDMQTGTNLIQQANAETQR